MRRVKRVWLTVLCCVFLVTVFGVGNISAADSFTPPEGKRLTALKEYPIAPGIKEQHITMVDSKGNNQIEGYAAVVNLKNKDTGILAGYKDYDTSGRWGMQTVRDQAASAQRKLGGNKNIVAATNGDYFNMSTGEPNGALVMGGKVVREAGYEYYFAILKDGTAAIRDPGTPMDDVEEAIGAPIKLVHDGKLYFRDENDHWDQDTSLMPRNSIGIREDGTVVLFGADGRQAPKSVGMTLKEVAQTMINMGCREVLYLDGGGSYTYASKSEGTKELTVKNSPSDGNERKVSSSLFVYSTAKATGEFDHASVSPDNEIYTPGSTVKFKAVGVDSAGGSAPLPSDTRFALKDASMGSITEDGEFKAGDKTGTVSVQLKSGDKVVGETSIEIRNPDSISFTNEEITMAFEEESDLGLAVKYQGRQIHYHDGDFNWTISDVKDAEKKDVDNPEELGNFKGNKFTSSDGKTLYGTITCTSRNDETVKGSINVIVGLQPSVVMDFESRKDSEGNDIPAEKYWDFNRASFEPGGGTILALWDREGNWLDKATARMLYGHYVNGVDPVNKTESSRGGKETAEIVNIASGEPVKKGNNSLKINYDFREANGTEGACVGFSSQTQEIPGNPTAIGMYVYCPEGTPNFWLRLRVKDGSDVVQTVNFTEIGCSKVDADKLGGLDWTGWKYVEAKLPGKGPYKLIGGETIRVMYLLNGSGNFRMENGHIVHIPKNEVKGSLYFDDLQFVYGANTTDNDNPIIGRITADGQELKEDTVVRSNDVDFEINVSDVQNKYASGIDYNTKNIWIDGKNITDKAIADNRFAHDESKETLFLYKQHLSNGEHSVKVLIRDKEGNEAVKSVSFSVDGSETDKPKVKTGFDDAKVYVGEKAGISLKSDKSDVIQKVTAEIKLGKDYSDYDVKYAEGFEENAEPKYSPKTGILTVSAKRKEGSAPTADGKIATAYVRVPLSVTKGTSMGFSIPSGEFEYKDESGEIHESSFVRKTQEAEIDARYTISADNTVAGMDTTFIVKTEAGKSAKNVGIYLSDDQKIGETDLNGKFATDKFRSAQKYAVYAKDEKGGYSFVLHSASNGAGANEDGTPTYIQLNAAKNSETTKNITWMSRPGAAEKAAVVKLALKKDYDTDKEKAFREYKGTAELLNFNGSSENADNRVVYLNTVELNGLKPDTDYVYMAGDGDEHWSEVRSFSTAYNGEKTNFFILGDTQTEDVSLENIMTELAKKKYAFGIQTGDFVEKADLYGDWTGILKLFDREPFSSTDMIHVTGNHELYGDTTGNIQKSLFNIESQRHYSVQYGNVYVAVLGFSSQEKDAKEYAEWLVSDASKSKAKWKIVVSHQPPYGTNETTDDCAAFTKYLPKACEKAGIDFMFSGHDHSLVRTNPTTNGKTDEANGVVYYVCGSTGGKSYTPSNSRGFNFAVDPTNDYDGIYLTAEATDSEFRVKVHEANGSELEKYSYTKKKETCENGLHEWYCADDEHLICGKCGTTRKITTDFSGKVIDRKSGLVRYLQDGKFEKNRWLTDGDESYYIGADGYAVTGTVTIDGKKYTFNRHGVFMKGSFVKETVMLKNGKQKDIIRYYEAGGNAAKRWRVIDGDFYYFRKASANSTEETNPDDGEMLAGGKFKIRTPGKNTIREFVFDQNGVLTRGAFEPEKDTKGKLVGTRYYWGDEYVRKSTVVDGVRYDFDPDTGYMAVKDIAKCSIAPIADQLYTGAALKPEIEITDGSQKLKPGTNFKVTYSENTRIGRATVTIKGNPSRGYKGTVRTEFSIVSKPKKPGKTSITSIKNIKKKSIEIRWKSVKGAAGYKVYRATSKKGKFKLVKTTKSRNWKNTKLKKGKTYYYKVRTYSKVSGKTIYGSYSSVKSKKIKK